MDVEDGVNERHGAKERESAVASATVPGGIPGAEANVIAEQQWQVIHERRAAGRSVSAIARELDLDRKTVRSALRRSLSTSLRHRQRTFTESLPPALAG
jgi:DNA invertase Pin-like site-specific DNA recombinase